MKAESRPGKEDFVQISFDGIKLKDAEKLDELGKKYFTREDGSYHRRDLLYFLLFQLRGYDDLFKGFERRMLAEMKKFREDPEGEHGKAEA